MHRRKTFTSMQQQVKSSLGREKRRSADQKDAYRAEHRIGDIGVLSREWEG